MNLLFFYLLNFIGLIIQGKGKSDNEIIQHKRVGWQNGRVLSELCVMRRSLYHIIVGPSCMIQNVGQ